MRRTEGLSMRINKEEEDAGITIIRIKKGEKDGGIVYILN